MTMIFSSSRLVPLACSSLLLVACSVFEPPLAQIDDETETDPNDIRERDGGEDDPRGDEPDAQAASDPDGAGEASDAGSTEGSEDAGKVADANTSCALPGVDPKDVCAGDIVINEIDGSGDDFIEIYNRGTVPINISNYVIADDSAGSPDVAEGIVVPVGTVLDPQRSLYVWSNLGPDATPADAGAGMLYTDCIPGAPPPCLHGSWGISAGGERIYLLNGALELVCAVNYPGAVFGGEAYGRIPDGSSILCPTKPTAGAANVESILR